MSTAGWEGIGFGASTVGGSEVVGNGGRAPGVGFGDKASRASGTDLSIAMEEEGGLKRSWFLS